jgi:hypothetical protein
MCFRPEATLETKPLGPDERKVCFSVSPFHPLASDLTYNLLRDSKNHKVNVT